MFRAFVSKYAYRTLDAGEVEQARKGTLPHARLLGPEMQMWFQSRNLPIEIHHEMTKGVCNPYVCFEKREDALSFQHQFSENRYTVEKHGKGYHVLDHDKFVKRLFPNQRKKLLCWLKENHIEIFRNGDHVTIIANEEEQVLFKLMWII